MEKDIEYIEIASFDKMKPMLVDLEWSESGEKLFFTKYPGLATPPEIREQFEEEGKGYILTSGEKK